MENSWRLSLASEMYQLLMPGALHTRTSSLRSSNGEWAKCAPLQRFAVSPGLLDPPTPPPLTRTWVHWHETSHSSFTACRTSSSAPRRSQPRWPLCPRAFLSVVVNLVAIVALAERSPLWHTVRHVSPVLLHALVDGIVGLLAVALWSGR